MLVPFVPLALLPLPLAFAVWTILSLALLVWSVRYLANHVGLRYANWPILLSLAFMPVASNLGNGQLSLIVLGAYVLTYSLWRKGRLFLGGLVLAITDFKFQLVVGFFAILLIRRKWHQVLGFLSGSAVFATVSVLTTGLPTLLRYPRFVRQTEGGLGS